MRLFNLTEGNEAQIGTASKSAPDRYRDVIKPKPFLKSSALLLTLPMIEWPNKLVVNTGPNSLDRSQGSRKA